MSFPIMNDLRNERIRQNVPLADLSESSGVSESTLSKIFSGKQDDCRLTTISDIAASMGLEVRAIPEGSLDNRATKKAVDAEMYDRLLAEKDKLAAQKDRIIATQKVYVRVLFILLVGILLALVSVLIVDSINGDWGYFR